MTYDQLRYFKRLAEVLSFTQAASDLFISQPALSSAITRLETEVGAKLLSRNRSGNTSLTEAGEKFYECACLAITDIENGIMLAREAERGANDLLLRIGVVPCMQSRAWSRSVNEFRTKSPHKPAFMIRQGYSPDLTSQLLRGDIEVAYMSKVGDYDRINYRLCAVQPIVLCVNGKHPWARKTSISIDDLKGRPVMTYDSSNVAYATVQRALGGAEIDMRAGYFDEMTMSSLVQADPQNMAIFCFSLVAKVFQDLSFIPIDGLSTDDYHKVYFAYQKTPQRGVVNEFIDYNLKYLDEHGIQQPTFNK